MLLQATLGLHIDTARMTVHVRQPRLPHDIDWLQVRYMKVGDQLVDLSFQRVEQRVVAFIENQRGSRKIHLSVHY